PETRVARRPHCSTPWLRNPHLGRGNCPFMALLCKIRDRALHKALHIQWVVIVTPSVYGTDNAATLYGMQARGTDARGVALIDEQTLASALDAMGQADLRRIRLNPAAPRITDPAAPGQQVPTAAAWIARPQRHMPANPTN